MKAQAHYIKADPGYSVVDTYLDGDNNDKLCPILIPIVAWQIRSESIKEGEFDVATVPVTIRGSDDSIPILSPDGKVHLGAGDFYNSVEEWLAYEEEARYARKTVDRGNRRD